MAKKKQFAPHIYQEWGELFENLTDKQNAEILKAITRYPDYEPENNPIWNFIKSQIEKDYEIFIDKCNKNGEISRNYWRNKNSNDIERIQTISNDIERYPKRITNNEITNNELRITETETKNKIPTREEIERFARQVGKKITSIDDFISYYASGEKPWCDDSGLPINWQRKYILWYMKEKTNKVSESKSKQRERIY